jgi:hypothetical protein
VDCFANSSCCFSNVFLVHCVRHEPASLKKSETEMWSQFLPVLHTRSWCAIGWLLVWPVLQGEPIVIVKTK